MIIDVDLLHSFDNYRGHRVALRFENDCSDEVLAAVKDSDIAVIFGHLHHSIASTVLEQFLGLFQ